jgi:hypothetical protein
MTTSHDPSPRTAYLDFDGVLFYSDIEPLYSALLAFGQAVTAYSIRQEWLTIYQVHRNSIANQLNLYEFVCTKLLSNEDTGIGFDLFQKKLENVRRQHIKSGDHLKLFHPTLFTLKLRERLPRLRIDICILTNRDHDTTKALCSESLSPSIRIVSLGMTRQSKLSYILSESGSSECLFIDDVASNLMANDISLPESLCRIHASWGYGSLLDLYDSNHNFFLEDQDGALEHVVQLAS